MAEVDLKAGRSDDKLDILLVTSDSFPPFRPAAKAVFAEGLAARGHRIDWLMQAAEQTSSSGEQRFPGGTAYVAATNAGTTRWARFRRYVADVRNDCRVFGLLKRHRYSLVQIKDKVTPISSVVPGQAVITGTQSIVVPDTTMTASQPITK